MPTSTELQKDESQTNINFEGYVKLIEGGIFLNYKIVKVNTESLNPGFWGILLDDEGKITDST
jgi:hypothetical protein